MLSRLTRREYALHVAGCVFICLLAVLVGWLLLWVAVHGGAALAGVRHSSVLPFGLVGYLFSLFALGCIVIGLFITLHEWQGIFCDISGRRGGVK